MEHIFRPRGVCSQLMRVEIENGIIKDVEVKATSCPDQLSKALRECLEKEAK